MKLAELSLTLFQTKKQEHMMRQDPRYQAQQRAQAAAAELARLGQTPAGASVGRRVVLTVRLF